VSVCSLDPNFGGMPYVLAPPQAAVVLLVRLRLVCCLQRVTLLVQRTSLRSRVYARLCLSTLRLGVKGLMTAQVMTLLLFTSAMQSMQAGVPPLLFRGRPYVVSPIVGCDDAARTTMRCVPLRTV
jgi:hypothetical protein